MNDFRHQKRRKRRRSALGSLLLCPFMIKTAFLDKASSFCYSNTANIPIQPWRISQPTTTATTLLWSTTGLQTSETNHVESIIPKGTPKQEYGTPVGAVILPGPCIEDFYKKCKETFPEAKHLRFRKVENHQGSTETGQDNGTFKAVHVQSEVAAALIDGDAPDLVAFIRLHGGHFLPGARIQREKQNRPNPSPNSTANFTFVELFAGVGGFRLGLETLGGSCVLASERDAMASAFYRRHFGDHGELVEGDILDVVSSDFPENGFDLLTAGFPCQPFSARGKKKGLDDDGHRGQMYQELVRILREEQPSFFLFENVVGLVTMDGGKRIVPHGVSSGEKYSSEHTFEEGRTMKIILDAFRSCGYKVEWNVVNCKQFCPQHRERVYFVGSKLELNCPDVAWENIYPTHKTDKLLRDFLEEDPWNSPHVRGCELSDSQWEMVQRKCGAETAEDAFTKVGLQIDEPSSPTLISSYKTPASLSARFVTEEADGTLRDGNPRNPRFLTPVEFRRIMGFPDTFEVTSPMAASNVQEGSDGVVDGHIYKVLGNAVVPSVIEAIGREIVRLMDEVEKQKNN